MKNNLLYSAVAGLLSIGSHANAKNETPRPYFIGPELYQIHTDARLFATRVFVNGNELKLSNPDGNGYIRNQYYDVSGATGYPNKNYLNAYLKPGENEIKVIFDAPLLEQVKGTKGEDAFIRDMYAHVVINKGELTDGSRGMGSYYLDEAIKNSGENVTILKDALLRRFTADQLGKEVSVIYKMTIDAKNASQVPQQDCGFELDGFSNFKGQFSVNGTTILDVTDYGQGKTLEDLKSKIVPGKNSFEVNVTSIKDKKSTVALLNLDCNMREIKRQVGLSEEEQNASFGSFFDYIKIPIAAIEFDKPGKYSTTFYYSE